jgi:flavin reductase (DIM6/NTAB) family NADH-FMN oxidoreductase RutF
VSGALDLPFAELSALQRYKLLVGLVIPRPIAWISTWSENGVANCAPYSFFNALSEDPALCIVSFGPRIDGAMKHTLKNIRRTGEFVVNLADEATANAMHVSSDEIPEQESEFSKTGLTPVPARLVAHPRIAEAPASFECRVYQSLSVHGRRELVIGEILLLHAREGVVDPQTMRVSETHYRPVGRLFASRYCTTRERFDLPGALPG